MNELDEELGLVVRAMRCKGWRVTKGMLDLRGHRLGELPSDLFGMSLTDFSVVLFMPDFKDAQTLGCLQGLVRAACDDPALTAVYDGAGEWRVKAAHGSFAGRSEAEALIKAWEEVR